MMWIAVGVLMMFMLFTFWVMHSWSSMGIVGLGSVNTEATEIFISVLIPVRNEESTIEAMLDSILENKIDHVTYEVIVIDDHSDDSTCDLVASIVNQHSHVKLIHLGDDFSGKKYAIATGVAVAQGEIILCTDGDCRVPETWLQCYQEAYSRDLNAKLVFGGVRYETNGKFLTQLLNVELSILVLIGAASMNRGIPTMINGANFSYKKATFLAVNGYKGNENIPSGDDEFLLRKAKIQFSSGVDFLKNPKSVVETAPPDSFMELIGQRRRWAAKWKYHQDTYSKFMPILIFLINASAIWAIFQLFTTSYSYVWFTFLVFKGIMDFVFMRVATKFMGVKGSILSFILLEIIYPFYVVFFAIASNFGRYSWKGRVYDN